MKHHSATFAIAEATGLTPKTVRKFLRHCSEQDANHRHQSGTWWVMGKEAMDEVVEALKTGRQLCQNHPYRRAELVQLSLFD